jgi:hypothetical protein
MTMVTTGSREGWLFGFTQALHLFNGHRTLTSFGSHRQVETATAAGAKDVWAFGGGPRRNGFAVRWNGHRWRSVAMPSLHLAQGESFDPAGSRAVSASNVWVCGVITHNRIPVLLNWTGTSWRRIPVPGHVSLVDLTTDGHGGIWMLGVKTSGVYSILHYSKGTVTSQPIPTKGLPGGVKSTSRRSMSMPSARFPVPPLSGRRAMSHIPMRRTSDTATR